MSRGRRAVQPAARWFLRRRPFDLELIDSLCHDADELPSVLSLALREEDSGKRVGSVTEPDNSSASEAARERLSSISPNTQRGCHQRAGETCTSYNVLL